MGWKTKKYSGKNRLRQSRAYQYHQNLVKKLRSGSTDNYQQLERLHRHSPFISFRWAFRGLYYAVRTQRNFRIELCCALITILSGLYLTLSGQEWSIILFSVFWVLGAELANTALEYMVDLYEKNFNYLAMMAKDIAAASVLLSAIHAIIQGVIIFGPHLRILLLRVLS